MSFSVQRRAKLEIAIVLEDGLEQANILDGHSENFVLAQSLLWRIGRN